MKYLVPALCLLVVAACAKAPRAAPKQAQDQTPSCPQTFVAKDFEQLVLVAEIRDTQHTLSFAKVQARCKKDKNGATLLNLSFALQLDQPLSGEQRKKSLLLPLFAVLTQDGKTVASRLSKRLETTFDKKGRAQTSWQVAIPRSLFASPEIAASATLYLGFDGEKVSIRHLRAQP